MQQKVINVGDWVVAKLTIDHCLTKDVFYSVTGIYGAWITLLDDRGIEGSYQSTFLRKPFPKEEIRLQASVLVEMGGAEYDEIIVSQDTFEGIKNGYD